MPEDSRSTAAVVRRAHLDRRTGAGRRAHPRRSFARPMRPDFALSLTARIRTVSAHSIPHLVHGRGGAGGRQGATGARPSVMGGEARQARLGGPQPSEPTQSTSSHDDGSYAGPVAIGVAGMLFGFLIASLLQNAFNLFPIRIIPIGVRRAIGMVTGPALAGGLCYITFGTDTAQIPIAPVTMAILIMSWMGWHFAPQGASRVWAKVMTWKEFFQDLLSVIIDR